MTDGQLDEISDFSDDEFAGHLQIKANEHSLDQNFVSAYLKTIGDLTQ